MPESWNTMQFTRGWDYVYFVSWDNFNNYTWENI